MRKVLFIHGAGGFLEDRPLARGLGATLGATVLMPHLPDEDMSFEAWADPVRRALASINATDRVIAHSFGASILMGVLADGGPRPASAALLAMPDWSPKGWDVAEYVFDVPGQNLPLSLHHCEDDKIVPFSHLSLNSARFPSAQVCPHVSGGHQFAGLIDELATDPGASR